MATGFAVARGVGVAMTVLWFMGLRGAVAVAGVAGLWAAAAGLIAVFARLVSPRLEGHRSLLSALSTPHVMEALHATYAGVVGTVAVAAIALSRPGAEWDFFEANDLPDGVAEAAGTFGRLSSGPGGRRWMLTRPIWLALGYQALVVGLGAGLPRRDGRMSAVTLACLSMFVLNSQRLEPAVAVLLASSGFEALFGLQSLLNWRARGGGPWTGIATMADYLLLVSVLPFCIAPLVLVCYLVADSLWRFESANAALFSFCSVCLVVVSQVAAAARATFFGVHREAHAAAVYGLVGAWKALLGQCWDFAD